MKILEPIWNYFSTPISYTPFDMLMWFIIALFIVYTYRAWQNRHPKICEIKDPKIKMIVIVQHMPDMILSDRTDLDLQITAFVTLDTYRTLLDHWEVASSFKASMYNVKSGTWVTVDIPIELSMYDEIHVVQFWSHDYCDYVADYSDYVTCNPVNTQLVTKSDIGQLPEVLTVIISTNTTRLENDAKDKPNCTYYNGKPVFKNALLFDSYTKFIHYVDITRQ